MPHPDKIYTRLDETRKEFRLIRVLPTDGDEINCELTTHSQPDATYRALSYCWTESLPTREITLNGFEVFVRPNLHEYLKQVKVERDDSLIFIDALCIHQLDEDEKSSQVRLMGSIYRGAEEVVAWLGVDGADRVRIDRAMSTLQASVAHEEHFPQVVKGPWDIATAFALACAVFHLEYWSRLWIFQEIVLAGVLVLQFRGIRLMANAAQQLCLFLKSHHINHGLDEFWDPSARGFRFRPRGLHKPTTGTHRYLSKPSPVFEHLAFPSKPLCEVWCAMSTAYTFFLIRKQLRFSAKHEAALPLSAAVMQVGSQTCARPYDKIFGIIGVTNSRLKVSYGMHKIALYLHVLIDATLDSIALRSRIRGHGGWRLIENSGVTHFYASLITQFQLAWENPIITLATTRSLETLRRRYDLDLPSYDEVIARIKRRFQDSNPRDTSHSRWNEITKARLQFHRLTGLPIAALEGDGPSKTYNQWVQWFDHIFTSVEAQSRDNTTPRRPLVFLVGDTLSNGVLDRKFGGTY